jgi:tetratricopeptide (TPR) repeat protein
MVSVMGVDIQIVLILLLILVILALSYHFRAKIRNTAWETLTGYWFITIRVLTFWVWLSGFINPLRWWEKVRNNLFFRLLFTIVIVFGMTLVILPLDPLNLEKSADGFNESSLPGPFVNVLINYTGLSQNDSFSQGILSDGPIFSIILSDPRLFDVSLNNSSILNYTLSNATVILSLKDEKHFDQIFSKNATFSKVFSDKALLADALPHNNSQSAEMVYKNQSLLNQVLNNSFSNHILRSKCYIEAANNFTDIKADIIEHLRSDNASKSLVIGALMGNKTLRYYALADIYKNSQANSVLLSLINQSSSLRYQIIKQEHPIILLFLAFIWRYWQAILVLWLLFELYLRFSGTKSNIEIGAFSDDTNVSDPSKKAVYNSLPTLLMTRLNRLGKLYQMVDEGRPIGSIAEGNRPIPAVIKAEDNSDLSSNLFSESSNLSFGGLSIPAKSINSLIAQILRRPSISGSLYKEGDQFILNANLYKNGKSQSWRVEGPKPSGPAKAESKEQKQNLDNMVEELACRIFTDLAFDQRSIMPWKATDYFTKGLRSYRDCLHGTADRRPKLLDARDNFEKALSEDEDFPWLHYNLGVAYSELDEKPSAEACFRKTINLYQDNWQPYYALAMNQFDAKNYDEAIQLCQKALFLYPGYTDSAKIYNLIGLAWRKKFLAMPGQSNGDLSRRGECNDNARGQLIAATICSLMGLLWMDRQVGASNTGRDVAAKCMKDLGHFQYEMDKLDHAKLVLNRAMVISPNDRNLHLEFAKVSHRSNDNEGAIKNIIQAKDPSNLAYWPCLVEVCSQDKGNRYLPFDPNLEKKAKLHVLDKFSRASAEEIRNLIEALFKSRERPFYYLYFIKSYNEGSNNASNWPDELLPDELLKWKHARETEKSNDPIKISGSIDELEPIWKFLAFSSQNVNSCADALKYAEILGALGSLYQARGKLSSSAEAKSDNRARCQELHKFITTNILGMYKKDIPKEYRAQSADLLEKWDLKEAKNKLENLEDSLEIQWNLSYDEIEPGENSNFLNNFSNKEKSASEYENECFHKAFEPCLIDLYFIKTYLEGVEDTRTWTAELMNWKGGEDALKTKNEKDVQSSIKNLEQIQKNLLGTPNKVNAPGAAIKYAIILRTLGSLYQFCYEKNIPLQQSENSDIKAKEKVRDVYNFIRGNVLEPYQDEIPNEYSEMMEELIRKWNMPRLRYSDFDRYSELAKRYPNTPIHRKNMARYYYQLGDYKQCRAEWKRAQLLDPDDPVIFYNIGVTYVKEALSLRDKPKKSSEVSENKSTEKSERNRKIENGKCYLERASRLLKDDIYKLRTYFWLGVLSEALKDYTGAIYYYRVADKLAENAGMKDEECLQIEANLGWAYLKNKEYNRSENILSKFDLFGLKPYELTNTKFLKEEVNERLGIKRMRGLIGVEAKLNLAFLYSDNEIKLKDAQKLIIDANEIIGAISQKEPRLGKEDDDEITALMLKFRGWLHYKQYKEGQDKRYFDGTYMASSITSPRITIERAVLGPVSEIRPIARDKFVLKNARISDAKISEFLVEDVSIKDINIKNIDILNAYIDPNTNIKFALFGGVAKYRLKDDRSMKSRKLNQVIRMGYPVESAMIENANLFNITIKSMVKHEGIVSASPYASNQLDLAIEDLNGSISLWADAEAYMFLALAYESKIQAETDAKNKELFKKKALMACIRSEDLDFNDEYSDQLSTLKERLQEKGDTPKKEKAAKEGTSPNQQAQGEAKDENAPQKGGQDKKSKP